MLLRRPAPYDFSGRRTLTPSVSRQRCGSRANFDRLVSGGEDRRYGSFVVGSEMLAITSSFPGSSVGKLAMARQGAGT